MTGASLTLSRTPPTGGTVRRGRRAGIVALVVAAAVLVGAGSRTDVTPPQGLFSEGVVEGPDGLPVAVPPGRVSDPDRLSPFATRQQRYADLRADALRDLDLMVLDGGSKDGAVLAGLHGSWRYSWARDAAWVAAALSVAGRPDDGLRVLASVQRDEQQRADLGLPGWQARYLPDGSGRTPDDRGVQLDGPGWALWAASVWAASVADPVARQAGLERLRPLMVSAAATARASIDPRNGLTRPSSDYWEVTTRVTTLGVAAPVLAGLRAAGPLLQSLSLPAEAAASRAAAAGLDAAIERTFGARGYPRKVSGGARDTSAAWLTPPFGPARAGSLRARDAAFTDAARTVGGVAPGASWEDNGVAWTPETAAFALSFAASGERSRAEAVLDWLEAHRTSMGSLPEKVRPDGTPASVAPLSWTAAAVLLTLAELDGTGVPHL